MQDGVRDEVALDEGVDGARTHRGGHVARLQVAQERVDEHPVTGLDRDLGEVLVRPVHGIAGLERGDGAPAVRFEPRPGLGRGQEQLAELVGEASGGEHGQAAREIHLALLHHHPDPRVLGVRRAEDRAALAGLVDGVLLRDLEDRHRRGIAGADERDLAAGRDPCGGRGIDRRGDRDGPEQAVRGAHLVAHPAPVGLAHEARERRETADAEHHDVARLARGDRHRGQGGGALARGGKGIAFGHQGLERRSTVRADETRHRNTSRSPTVAAQCGNDREMFREGQAVFS